MSDNYHLIEIRHSEYYGSKEPLMFTKATIDKHAEECPVCARKISPIFIWSGLNHKGNLDVVYRCTSLECDEFFISHYQNTHTQISGKICYSYKFLNSQPKFFRPQDFSAEIQDISSEFVAIFNQAREAESKNLDRIAGVGYRKVLEFLIKDYCISLVEEDKQESIRKKFLTKVIKEDLDNQKIATFAEKAVWLGNDETHYVRVWEDKDMKDLKLLIDIVVDALDFELKGKKLNESFNRE
jgi:hypothetical protein